MKPEKTGRRCVLILLILLAAVFSLSFLLGWYRVSALQTARLLADRALSGVSRGHLRLAPTWTPEEASVVIQIRLPRILSAALIGAALSAAGASYQAMFRNPMVSPDLLGASTGASSVRRWRFCSARATPSSRQARSSSALRRWA